MKFKDIEEPIFSMDPHYDLFDGGYIKPEELLKNQKDIDKVNEAVETIREFFEGAERAGVLVVE